MCIVHGKLHLAVLAMPHAARYVGAASSNGEPSLHGQRLTAGVGDKINGAHPGRSQIRLAENDR